MRAAILNVHNLTFKIRDVDMPVILEDEALLRVEACGICGTDRNIYRRRFDRWKKWRMLMLAAARRAKLLKRSSEFNELRLGHEICGIVKEASRPEFDGKKVVVSPSIPCGICWSCQHGIETTCEHFSNVGFERAGGFAEFVSVPQQNIFEIPKTLDSSLATLSEPMACGLHAIDVAEVKKSDTVLVVGAGAIGQLITHICSTEYTSKIVVCDPHSFRLKIARELGAMDTIKPNEMKSQELFPNIVFECVGGPSQTIDSIIDIIQPRGTICVVGIPQGKKPIRLSRLQAKEAKIRTSRGYESRNHHDAITRIESYAAKLQFLITHKFSLEEISEAFYVATKHGDYNGLKVVIEP